MYDIAVIGSGPAGISAAITALVRGKSVAVVSNPASESGLYKAERIDNYPGLPAVSGAELSDAFISHARSLGAELFTGKVQTILPNDDTIFVGYGMEKRARLVIERCAHPDYREALRAYFDEACAATHGAQTPQLLGRSFSFHENLAKYGSMLAPREED